MKNHKMPNDIKLQSQNGTHPVDENLRPILVGDKLTAIETAQHGNGARVNGDLTVTGEIKGKTDIQLQDDITCDDITCDVLTATTITSTDLTIDDAGDITLDAAGDNILLKGVDGDGLDFTNHHTGSWNITNLTSDGDIFFYINDGGASKVVMTINGAEPYIGFNNAGVGFSRKEAGFSITSVIGSGGTDDTDIDFRTGNKFRLEMTGDITTMNLIFPTVSGNFVLVCTTNGDHDVTNWKAFESDASAATTADVMWAGGSVPAFTNNGIDIVSFYWDVDEQQAYGVASLAFATP